MTESPCSAQAARGPLLVGRLRGSRSRRYLEILGHSQIAIIMNTYTHIVHDTQREAVSHMDRLLRYRPDRD